ncbi:hypothetical protein J8TS2_10700 [Lederbergia ruris]|uniref:Uncharacterized protein n=1 Tax=Lederbergia ruris TaxID=217495 RepID=A0ABQ4KFK0_9BACI|nr:hypothetical protein J8TS2_10700 [Lederbergia ruris]
MIFGAEMMTLILQDATYAKWNQLVDAKDADQRNHLADVTEDRASLIMRFL